MAEEHGRQAGCSVTLGIDFPCFGCFGVCLYLFFVIFSVFWQTSHESPEKALKSPLGGQKNLPRQLAVFVAEPVLTGSDPKKHCFFF